MAEAGQEPWSSVSTRAFCPGFSGGAPAAVSSARVFVFRWRGPGTAGEGVGEGVPRAGCPWPLWPDTPSLGHTPLLPGRATRQAARRGSTAPLGPGKEKQGWDPWSFRRSCPPFCPLRLAVGGSGHGVPGALLSAGLLCLVSFICQLLRLGRGQQGPSGSIGASPLHTSEPDCPVLLEHHPKTTPLFPS